MSRYNNYHKHDHVSNIFSPDSNAHQIDYIKRCIELGHTNYFTTNHGSFGDIFEARRLCNENGLRCIAGMEGYIVPDPLEKDKSNYHIVIIPKTDAARKKMNYCSSHANIDGYYYKPRLFLSDLLELSPNDVFITTACVAGIIRDERAYKEIFYPLFKHFGENMLLEVQAHNEDIQKEINQRVLKLHNKYGLKIIAGCDSHYIYEQDQAERLELLKGKHITYDSKDSFILDFPDDNTLFDRFLMQGVLSEQQIEESINNTLVFDECEEIQLDYSIKMPTIYPELTPEERVEELKKIVTSNFKKIAKKENIKGAELEKYKEGIRYEMKIIEDTNEAVHSADYFLFNARNVDLAVNKYGGVLTRGGRGSCASFYINRVLNITQLDRFKINLPIFPDRFMSVARAVANRSLADIDYNVKEQEPFVKASRELLGEHGCYPMVSYGLMQQSEAFRNVCRSHELPYEQYNDIAKSLDKHVNDDAWKPYIEEAQKYVGTIISASVHPCAHLLCNENILYEYGVTRLGEFLCVLITSSEADEYKVLKNDYLIVTVWKLISETFDLIGIPIIDAHELFNSIKNDDRIWNLFRDGITCTLNQVDTDNGAQQAKRYGIKSFEDGALLAAAIRPSFDSWREKFLNHEEYTTGSDKLDDVLKMTHSYILFQENLMQYFEWLGVTPSESIGLIKKISKKKIKEEDFARLEERIKSNWIKQTGSEDMFAETWSMIQSCMAYGFASPHAAATSLDMCYGAYLKVHYPLEYYTVCFNNYETDKDKTRKLTKELKYFDISLGEIKFRHSGAKYTFDRATRTIYKGVSSVQFISDIAANVLYAMRDNQYSSFVELLQDIKETKVNSRQLDILIKLDFFSEFGEINELLQQRGVFDELYGKKQIKFEKWQYDPNILRECAGKCTEKMAKDFDSITLIRRVLASLEPPETTPFDKVMYEKEFLGYISTTIPDIMDDCYYVTGTTGYNNKTLVLYNLKNGDTLTIKNRTKGQKAVKEDDIIRITEMENTKKYKPLGKDENGKMQFERIDEYETVLTGFSFVNVGGKNG